jgi:hypothetical protein
VSVKFFGQFLIEKQEVSASQVREALDLLEKTNRNLGEIAVAEGILSEQQAQQLNQRQRSTDMPFGDLAVMLGLMSREQLVACLRQQRETRLLIGEALVQLGHVAEARLDGLLARFDEDQAPYRIDPLTQLPDALVNNRVAPYLIALLPRFCMRVARITVKVGPARVLDEAPPLPVRVALPVHAHRGLEVTLVGDRAFARRLAAATAGLSEPMLDEELVLDGVGEFLNVLVGNAVSALEREGVVATLGVPDYDAELSDGWLFHLATSVGRAALVLAQF